MRCLLRALSLCTCFGILHFQRAEGEKVDRPNFSGSWTLDVRASNSIDPLMKYIEAGPLERAYAAWAPLQTTMLQNGDELIVATRGPGFALDQTLYLDGRIDRDNLRLFGPLLLTLRRLGQRITDSSSKFIKSKPLKAKTVS